MPKKSKIESWKRGPKHEVRIRNRCNRCGRPRGYVRVFGMCRICVRQLAHLGHLPGMKKASW